MKLTELVKKANENNIEVFTQDRCNIFLVKAFKFQASPQIFKIGIQLYSSTDCFRSDICESIAKEESEIAVFDENASAKLYGDVALKGTLFEIREHLKSLNIQNNLDKRLWVEHLGQTARLDRFMHPCWYMPLLSRDSLVIGLPTYLNNLEFSSDKCCSNFTAQYALKFPRITN